VYAAPAIAVVGGGGGLSPGSVAVTGASETSGGCGQCFDITGLNFGPLPLCNVVTINDQAQAEVTAVDGPQETLSCRLGSVDAASMGPIKVHVGEGLNFPDATLTLTGGTQSERQDSIGFMGHPAGSATASGPDFNLTQSTTLVVQGASSANPLQIDVAPLLTWSEGEVATVRVTLEATTVSGAGLKLNARFLWAPLVTAPATLSATQAAEHIAAHLDELFDDIETQIISGIFGASGTVAVTSTGTTVEVTVTGGGAQLTLWGQVSREDCTSCV
jgi:hypothetical protein